MGWSQPQVMAVIDVRLQGEAKKYFSIEERNYLSNMIRGQALQSFGKSVEILSQEKYQKLVRANSEGCNQAGCFPGFISQIGAELGVQPTIAYAFGTLKMTLEIADDKSTIGTRTLSAPATEEGKNQLGEQVEATAKELFLEASARMGIIPTVMTNSKKSSSAITKIVNFEFLDGAAALLIDNQVACSSKKKCRKELSAGSHSVLVSREGFHDSSWVINIPADSSVRTDSLQFYLSLVANQGLLLLRAKDSLTNDALEAEVWFDDMRQGVTPGQFNVNSRVKSIELRLPAYKEYVVSARPADGQKQIVLASMTSKGPLDRSDDVFIPKGCFTMGDIEGNNYYNKPHRVCLNEFFMERTEVSQKQFLDMMHVNPSKYHQDGIYGPVESVTWLQASQYCEYLGKKLPTEAQWEYAAKAGSDSSWFWVSPLINRDDTVEAHRYARYNSGYYDRLQPNISEFREPNGFGLYDMQGNVSEWVADIYDEDYYKESPVSNPTGPQAKDPQIETTRVYRGGDVLDDFDEIRLDLRHHAKENDSDIYNALIGFRCVSR